MNFEIKHLNAVQLRHFNQFLLKQLELTQSRKINSLYRGDNLENLFHKLNVNYSSNDPDYDQLLAKLFMIGEKGKHFYANSLFGSSRKIETKIDDCDRDVFNFIFDNLNNSIKSKNRNKQEFFKNNSHFAAFFDDKRKNKQRFLEAAASLREKEKISLRNYYLSLLHQLGAINYSNKSHFVSTTTSSKVAKRFAGATNAARMVRIHLWVPSRNFKSRFEHCDLPIFIGRPYKFQHEVSVLAGILPHYISGLEIINDKKFFVNPSIFTNSITTDIFLDGLNINQERFEEARVKTNYRSSFSKSGEHVSEN